MSTRYKSSTELTAKYIKGGVDLTKAQRDAWISLRAKEIMKDNNYDDNADDRGMARMEAEAEYDRSVPSAVKNARLTKEGLDRTRNQIADAQRASATVQNNSSATPTGKLEVVVPGKVLKDTSGKKVKFYDTKGKPLSHVEVVKLNLEYENGQKAVRARAKAAAEKLREENEKKEKERQAKEDANPEALKKYIKSTQALLFNKYCKIAIRAGWEKAFAKLANWFCSVENKFDLVIPIAIFLYCNITMIYLNKDNF